MVCLVLGSHGKCLKFSQNCSPSFFLNCLLFQCWISQINNPVIFFIFSFLVSLFYLFFSICFREVIQLYLLNIPAEFFFYFLISKSVLLFSLLFLFCSALFLFHGCRSDLPVVVHASGVLGQFFCPPCITFLSCKFPFSRLVSVSVFLCCKFSSNIW